MDSLAAGVPFVGLRHGCVNAHSILEMQRTRHESGDPRSRSAAAAAAIELGVVRQLCALVAAIARYEFIGKLAGDTDITIFAELIKTCFLFLPLIMENNIRKSLVSSDKLLILIKIY